MMNLSHLIIAVITIVIIVVMEMDIVRSDHGNRAKNHEDIGCTHKGSNECVCVWPPYFPF